MMAVEQHHSGNPIMTSKASISADLRALGVELSASKLKKTTLAELQAMLDAKGAEIAQPKRVRRTKGVFRDPRPASEFKPTKPGSKRHLMAEALLKGATIEDLMTVTGWNRATASSAILADMFHGMGAGLRTDWDEDGTPRYFLVLPEGVRTLVRG